MSDEVEILRKIAEVARLKFLKVQSKYGEKMGEKVSRSAYGHRSSLMDVEVENEIINYVEENDLPFNIFTEERGWIDRGERDTLIVDPIDGSYNAEHGLPFFSVSLAIGRDSLKSVRAALVKNIPLDLDYWAVKGNGAFKGNSRMHTSGGSGLYVVYMGRNASDNAYRIARKARRIRDLGCASLELITVAEGISDVFYYSFRNSGALRIVDIAAAYLITLEAGGAVLDEELNAIDMRLGFEERKNVIGIADSRFKEVFS